MDTATSPVQQQYEQEANELHSHISSHRLLAPESDPEKLAIRRVDLRPDDRCFLLYNLLSPKECQYFIDSAEDVGLDELHLTNKNYRNHARCVVMSPEVSAFLWERFKSHILPITVEPEDYKQIGLGHRLEGEWVPVGLNPCWRLSRYYPGGHFGPHFDGPFVQDNNNRSLKTLNIYLNGDFEGGTTNLVNEGQMLWKDEETGLYKANEENILHRIKPEGGMALIFNHHILHEGEGLQTNKKYLLRSDIMFRRANPPALNPNEEKALTLVAEAERLEDAADFQGAVTLYSRAYKLWPELENRKLSGGR